MKRNQIKVARTFSRLLISLVLLTGCDNSSVTSPDLPITPQITSVSVTNSTTLTIHGNDLMSIDQVTFEGGTVSLDLIPNLGSATLMTAVASASWASLGVVSGQPYRVTIYDQDTNNSASVVITFP